MRVVTSSFGTFHMFDQAVQLDRRGLLSRFISGPPAYFAKKRGISPDKVVSLWPSFAIGYLQHRASPVMPAALRQSLLRLSHDHFSRHLASEIPCDTDIFIGLSSFCAEAVEAANERGIITVVDHGSLHEAFAKNQLLMEQDSFGFQVSGNAVNEWLIEKQDREFADARYVFALSELARKTLIDNGVSAAKIMVNRCGVSLKKFVQKPKRDKVFRVAFCGQICPGKGIHYLFEAFRALNMAKAELWVIGSLDGVKGDAHFNRMLQSYYAPNVKFFGAVDSDTLADLFSQCSVFVLPSLADGFGMAVTQAMACGLPVIVSNHTGAADILREGESGFVVPARDVNAMVDRLSLLASKSALAQEIGQVAKQSVESGLTWDDYGDRLIGLLRTMFLSHRRSQG